MNVNARRFWNWSRSANTNSSVNCAKFATEPLTSQSTTSSVRWGRFGLWWVTRGTPPVEMEARTVRRKSSGPRRRAWCSWVSRVASRRASG
jgi:hypothetical protein